MNPLFISKNFLCFSLSLCKYLARDVDMIKAAKYYLCLRALHDDFAEQ